MLQGFGHTLLHHCLSLDLWQENFQRLIFVHFVQEAQVEVGVQSLCERLPEGVQVCHALCVVERHQASLVVQVHSDPG